MVLSEAARVWNRACLDRGGPAPLPGDAALAAMVLMHSLIMNGGVLHAVAALDEAELEAGFAGYRLFGVADVIPVLERARGLPTEDQERFEATLDAEYGRLADDGLLLGHFEQHFAAHRELYAPLT